MTELTWKKNLKPAPQSHFDFDKLPILQHPLIKSVVEPNNISENLTKSMFEDFEDISKFLSQYSGSIEKRNLLQKLKSIATPPLPITFDELKKHEYFSNLNNQLNKIEKKISEHLDENELKVFYSQFKRIRTELFRFLYFKYLQRLKYEKVPQLNSYNTKIVEDLNRHGVVNAKMSKNLKEKINQLFAPFLEEALSKDRSKRDLGTYDKVKYFDPVEDNIIYKQLRTIFLENSILQLASNYNKVNMDLNRITLHIASAKDEHIYQTFNNKKYKPKTINIHFDPKYGILKLIIYLNEPENKDGPFCYVPGSNQYKVSRLSEIVGKANSVTNYLQNETEIKTFLKLPKQLQKNAIFGSMLTDNQESSKDILKKEVWLNEQIYGDLFLFDPSGIHRGGLCKQDGCRYALQIGLRPTLNGKFIKGL